MTTSTDAPPANVQALVDHLAGLRSVVVALSGGVDSSVVAKAATLALGERAVAVTGISASLPDDERASISAFVRAHGIRHELVTTDELARPEYQKNNPDRCFFCKDTLYGSLDAVKTTHGFDVVVDGTHAGDLAGHRPGRKAATLHGVRSPLVDLGFSKDDVRVIARALGLENAERASSPCLSSRIAYGLPVTNDRLRMVEEAEGALRAMGFSLLRVRHHEKLARIEIPRTLLVDAAARADAIVAAVKAAGFVYVTLDLAGIRSGSLLEVLENRDG